MCGGLCALVLVFVPGILALGEQPAKTTFLKTTPFSTFPEILRQEKRAQRLSFWVRRPPGGVGVFHAKGRWPKTSCPPSKLCLPWVSKRGIRDVPGILPGCPGPLAVFKKFVQKNFVLIFRPLNPNGGLAMGGLPERRQLGQKGPFRGHFCSPRGREVRRKRSQSAPKGSNSP